MAVVPLPVNAIAPLVPEVMGEHPGAQPTSQTSASATISRKVSSAAKRGMASFNIAEKLGAAPTELAKRSFVTTAAKAGSPPVG
jgi:hypothetical protein